MSKTCKTCGNDLPAAGVMICQECADALTAYADKKTMVDPNGYEYIVIGHWACDDCRYVDHDAIDDLPCRDCYGVEYDSRRMYFKPKEADNA